MNQHVCIILLITQVLNPDRIPRLLFIPSYKFAKNTSSFESYKLPLHIQSDEQSNDIPPASLQSCDFLTIATSTRQRQCGAF